MKTVFLDSSFFKAVIDPKDDFYSPQEKFWQTFLDNKYLSCYDKLHTR